MKTRARRVTHVNISLTLLAAAAVGLSNIAGVASKNPFGLYGKRVSAGRASSGLGAFALSCPLVWLCLRWSGSAMCASTSGLCDFPLKIPCSAA